MNQLPEDFLDIVKNLYKGNYKTILDTYSKDKKTTFRINTLKTTIEETLISLRSQGFVIKKGDFENSFIVEKVGNSKLSETEEFNAGKIYVQELSSMIPPIILSPVAGEYILDMTAAPGSKTTQMAGLSSSKANIMAIEKNKVRYEKLKHNLNLQGTKVKTKLDNAIVLHKKYPEFVNFFDKILLDAPCSSEGRFDLNNPKTYKYWSIKKVKEMQNQQRRLLNTAVQLLKPGGTLIYSTCTINTKENEENVDWVLNKYSKLKVKGIKLEIKNTKTGITEIEGKKLNKDIKRTVRIIPSQMYGGFFIAKLTKTL